MKKLILLLFLFSGVNCFSQSLPDFSFTSHTGEKINRRSLSEGNPVIIVYFDPYCDHCLTQAEVIKAGADQLKNASIIWVSWSEHDDNETFYNTYFSGAKNVKVCKDENFAFDSWFGYSEVPSVFVYNGNWQLSAKFTKEATVDQLVKATH